LSTLHHRFSLNEDVFRVLFTIAPAPKAGVPLASATANP